MLTPFTIRDLGDAISLLKNGKAQGLDNIHHEMIKCFGPTTRFWLLDRLNDCLKQQQIPNVWRKAKVVALLKPGKDPESPKSYRPIALLCSLYKLLERMILTRLQCKIEHILIPQQAGFRPGKSCCSQVLNLTQHIEDGFELGQITGAAFIDLTAAYDTINHRRLLVKLVMITDDVPLTKFIRTMLSNRRFKVELNGKQSRRRNQRNGLPQGSVLSPLLFNVYTNDQPLPVATNSFIYADDLCLTTQQKTFEQVETTLASGLNELASKSGKDPSNSIPPKEPPSRPQTECHLERYEARPYTLTCLPWHHTRPLTHLPKPLPQDARKTLLQKQPPQEAAWYELGRVPPHHEEDGDSTMSLRGGVLLSCLGPFHASQARRHNVK